MNLIDTYVSEVGRHLPKKTRLDIEAEIRSTLEDMLEERGQKTGKPVDDELVVEVLKEFGAPEKVAASYQGERYLIGPRLYPIFEKVFFILLPITVILALVGLGISLGISHSTARDVISLIFQTFGSLTGSVITTLGSLVLIFAVIELAMRAGKIDSKSMGSSKEKLWDPRSLEKISPPNQVKLGEGIVEIVFSFAAILIFNFFPQILGFTTSLNSVVEGGSWSSVTFHPIFTDLFFSRFVPLLTIVWVLDILNNILLLRMGSWKLVTRLGDILVRAGNIAIGFYLLATPGLLNNLQAIINFSSLDASTADLLATMARQGFASIVVIIMIVEGIEIVKQLYRIVVRGKSS